VDSEQEWPPRVAEPSYPEEELRAELTSLRPNNLLGFFGIN